MIELVEIMNFELQGFVEAAYENDEELLTKYHIRPLTLDEAVQETMNMIMITSVGLNMKYFGLLMDGDKIGYICVFENNLYSFALNIDYRVPSILQCFWENIVEILGDSFICMLYPNNTRAIKWLERQGMCVVDGVEVSCVTLLKVKEPHKETVFSNN